MELNVGNKTKTGFALIKKIESLDEFWDVITKHKSLFARHRMYPTAFFFSWQVKLVKEWISRGWFFVVTKLPEQSECAVSEYKVTEITVNGNIVKQKS